MSGAETQIEPLGGVRWRRLTVGTTPVLVQLSPNERTRSVLLIPDLANTVTILVGDSAIHSASGVPIYVSMALDLNLFPGELYAVAPAASQTLYVMALVDVEGQ